LFYLTVHAFELLALLHSRSSLASFMCVYLKAASWRAVVCNHDNRPPEGAWSGKWDESDL